MKIVDILQEPEETCSCKIGEEKHRKESMSPSFSSSSSSNTCSKLSLKWAVTQWPFHLKKKKRLKKKVGFGSEREGSGKRRSLEYWVRQREGKEKGKEEGEVECGSDPSPSLPSRLQKEVQFDPEKVEKSVGDDDGKESEDRNLLGDNSRNSSFNLVMGFNLMLLFSKTADEFNKMVELRKEMETLLKGVKEKIEKTTSSESSNLTNYPMSSYSEAEAATETTNNTSCVYQQTQHQSSTSQVVHTDCKTQSNGFVKFKTCGSGRIQQLEAELESELERLQIGLLNEDSELSDNAVEAIGSNKDFSTCDSNSMIPDIQIEAKEQDCGVSPYELERRLHELLETRQQEHIEELQSTLEFVEKRLEEKENEILLWRDAARLAYNNKQKLIRCKTR